MATIEKSSKRTANRKLRRQQLIAAAVKCIARKGIGSTTTGDVASEAGLSQGIINLHFESKDNLLSEALRHLSDEYRTQFDRVLKISGPAAADKLRALMKLDLSPAICDRRKIAVWFAFWGEVKWRPAYRSICEESDEYYDAVTERLCDELVADGRYQEVTGAGVATVLTSMTNGLWLSCLVSPKLFNRRKAMDSIDEYLRCVFPKHFPAVRR